VDTSEQMADGLVALEAQTRIEEAHLGRGNRARRLQRGQRRRLSAPHKFAAHVVGSEVGGSFGAEDRSERISRSRHGQEVRSVQGGQGCASQGLLTGSLRFSGSIAQAEAAPAPTPALLDAWIGAQRIEHSGLAVAEATSDLRARQTRRELVQQLDGLVGLADVRAVEQHSTQPLDLLAVVPERPR
jgi:hypothetical protein